MGELDEAAMRVLGRLFGVRRGGDEVGELDESEENDMERSRRCWVEIGMGLECWTPSWTVCLEVVFGFIAGAFRREKRR